MFLRLILTSVGILAVTNIYPGIRVDSNAFMLYLSAWIVYGLHVDGFFAAFIGSLMISTIVTFLNGVVKSRS